MQKSLKQSIKDWRIWDTVASDPLRGQAGMVSERVGACG